MTQLREIANQMELLIGCGYNKPLTKIDLSDKVNIIQTVTLHKVILGSLAELWSSCTGSLGCREKTLLPTEIILLL